MDKVDFSVGLASRYREVADEMRSALLAVAFTSLSSSQKEWASFQKSKSEELKKRLLKIIVSHKTDMAGITKDVYRTLKLDPIDSNEVMGKMGEMVLRSQEAMISLIASGALKKKSLTEAVMVAAEKNPPYEVYESKKVGLESAVNAEIQVDINSKETEKMLQSGNKLWRCDVYADSAKDHAAFQGKVYVLKKYQSEYPDLVAVEDIIAAPVRLTTRWNCRHRLSPVSDDNELFSPSRKQSIKAEKDRGKQRYLERYIRSKKTQMELSGQYAQAEESLTKPVYATIFKRRFGISPEEMLKGKPPGLPSYKTIAGKVNAAESELRELILKDDYLSRNYEREKPGFKKEAKITEVKTQSEFAAESEWGLAEKAFKARRDYAEAIKNNEKGDYLAELERRADKAVEDAREADASKADEKTFFFDTKTTFSYSEPLDKEPDHVSFDRDGNVSSEYWYTEKGVYRRSDHWGYGVASCDWQLEGSPDKHLSKGGSTLDFYSKRQTGFSSWEDFKKNKVQFITLTGENGSESHYLVGFGTSEGKNNFKINGKNYIAFYSSPLSENCYAGENDFVDLTENSSV
jgi:hypothetical protein